MEIPKDQDDEAMKEIFDVMERLVDLSQGIEGKFVLMYVLIISII